MSYNLALYSSANYISPAEIATLKAEEKAHFDRYNNYVNACLSLIEQVEENPDPKQTRVGQEDGIFSTIGDFLSTMIRTAKRIVVDTIDWIGRKVKSLINFRAKQKKFRDAKFEQLRQLWGNMPAERRASVSEKFAQLKIDFTPSFEAYKQMCISFGVLIKEIDQAALTYISQDIAIFGTKKAEGQKLPDWVVKLYEEEQTRTALVKFGIKLEDKNFLYKSPFVEMPTMTLGDLGYGSVDAVSIVNSMYQEHCWKKMPMVLDLKRNFEKFERQFEDRARDLKKSVTKLDKKDIAASTKSVSTSVVLAGRLTAYITQVEEALDTRRGWLIDAGIRACGMSAEG